MTILILLIRLLASRLKITLWRPLTIYNGIAWLLVLHVSCLINLRVLYSILNFALKSHSFIQLMRTTSIFNLETGFLFASQFAIYNLFLHSIWRVTSYVLVTKDVRLRLPQLPSLAYFIGDFSLVFSLISWGCWSVASVKLTNLRGVVRVLLLSMRGQVRIVLIEP